MDGTKRRLLREIIIDDYPDKVLIAKNKRAIPYVSNESKVKGSKKIPKTYIDNPKFYFDSKGVLTKRSDDTPVLANPKSAGQPRFWVVNFQEIWNGAVSRQNRAMKADKLKRLLEPYLDELPPIQVKDYPVKIEVFLFNTEFPVDASNKGVIYHKIIEDILVKAGVLVDDSENFINDAGRTKLIRVSDEKDKKMIVRIVQSDNLPY
jgi:hypothetical protein